MSNKKISELVKATSSNATDEFVLSRGATNVSIQAQYISALSASYALTASYAVSSSVEIKQEITSSYAETASYAYSTTILSGSTSDARNELVTKISGSSLAPITSLSASLTSTNQAISSSVATLSGSASDARNSITNVLSSSYALTASHALNVPSTASYAVTASYALNGGSGSNPSIGSVGYDALDNSFKTRASNVTLSSGTTSAIIDFDSSVIFEITTPTDTTATTLNFDNAEIGMSKMVLIVNQGTEGSGTITLGQTVGTGTFIRSSSDDIVRTISTTNYLQITCIGESGDDRTFVYTVGTAQ